MFPNFEMFCQVMDQCTENYECLVIHNNAKSNKLTDQVFWYKADSHDDFRLCSHDHWQYSASNEEKIKEDGGVQQSSSKYTITKQWT
jgi:hypothetical protein